MAETPYKLCTRCGQTKPHDEFHAHPGSRDGLQARCKECNRTIYRTRYASRKAPVEGSDLYIVEFEKLPGTYKIGHSKHPDARPGQIQSGQPSFARLVRVYEGLGWAEPIVQLALRDVKTPNCPSREWFTCAIERIYAEIERITGGL